MTTLEEHYASDQRLLEFYKIKLLVPGWAGQLRSLELAYIKEQLMKSQ